MTDNILVIPAPDDSLLVVPVGGDGRPGAPGAPGGNIMAIGLFSTAGTLAIPGGTDIVRTSGYATAGLGVADYVYDAAVDAAYVAANPRTSFRDTGGRGFRLVFEGVLNARQVGAMCDAASNGSSGTDDTTAMNAAISFLAARGGGTIFIPAHTKCTGSLNANGLRNIGLEGPEGGAGGYGIFPPAQLIYTGTGARFIDFRSTLGCEIRNLGVRYTSGLFAGDLVDYSHDGSASDATYGFITRCVLGGIGAYSARRCVNLLDAILCTIKDNHICCAAVGVGGKLESSPGYSNAHTISENTFDNLTTSAVVNVGEAWSVENNRFEGTNDGVSGGMPRAFWDDFTVGADNVILGLKWSGNWHGDDVNVHDAWFSPNHALLRGCSIDGGYFGNQFGGGSSIKLGRTAAGLSIRGASLKKIDLGSVAHFGVHITGNFLEMEVANLTDDSRDIFIAGNSLIGSLTSKSIIRLSDPREFGVGIGGGVTAIQGTSRATLVTCHAMSGQVNLFNEAGSSAWSFFQVNNDHVKATDTVHVNQKYTGSSDAYEFVTQTGTGFFLVFFRDLTGTATESIVMNFTVHSGSNN